MINTGATYTYINTFLVPIDYPTPLSRIINTIGFNGSITNFTHKVKPIMMRIGSLRTNLPPLINPTDLPTSYDMILGINFFWSIREGLTIMPSGLMIQGLSQVSSSLFLCFLESFSDSIRGLNFYL